MTSFDLTAQIAVENTTYSFDKPFCYLVPQHLKSAIKVGMRVLVPFGRGNKKRQGIVLFLEQGNADNKLDEEKLKSIISLVDNEPVLNEELISLAVFMKEHYFCTLYDAVKTMLPAGINYHLTTVYGIQSSDENALLDAEEQRIYDFLLKKRKPFKAETILDAFGLSDTRILDEMVSKNILYKSD